MTLVLRWSPSAETYLGWLGCARDRVLGRRQWPTQVLFPVTLIFMGSRRLSTLHVSEVRILGQGRWLIIDTYNSKHYRLRNLGWVASARPGPGGKYDSGGEGTFRLNTWLPLPLLTSCRSASRRDPPAVLGAVASWIPSSAFSSQACASKIQAQAFATRTLSPPGRRVFMWQRVGTGTCHSNELSAWEGNSGRRAPMLYWVRRLGLWVSRCFNQLGTQLTSPRYLPRRMKTLMEATTRENCHERQELGGLLARSLPRRRSRIPDRDWSSEHRRDHQHKAFHRQRARVVSTAGRQPRRQRRTTSCLFECRWSDDAWVVSMAIPRRHSCRDCKHHVRSHEIVTTSDSFWPRTRCSYQRINNSYGCANSATLNGLLKTELGFQGFVVSGITHLPTSQVWTLR